jgi:excinuclease UvrABC helicase subunit UvrB
MRVATAACDFQRCIVLRDRIRPLKKASLEAQITAAAASGQFEVCIQLRDQLNSL